MGKKVTGQQEAGHCDEPGRLGAYYIRGCLQGAVQKGFDPHTILKAADIDPAVYDDPEASIDGVQMQRLYVAAAEIMNDTYLGFMDNGNKQRAGYLVGVAAVNCGTFGEALKQICVFVDAFRTDVDLKQQLLDDDVELLMRVRGLVEGFEPHILYWLETYWFYKFLCWLVGQRIPLKRIRFQSTEPDEPVDYTLLFDCPIEFDEDSGALCFDRDVLKLPVIRTEAELRGGDFVDQYADWFEIPGSEQSLARKIEQLLVDLYEEGSHTPTLQVLADMLYASPRTISRRLHKENTTFQDLKDKVRRRMADQLLRGSELPVSSIAERVGFWEPADFTRAYVRWTGITPSEYRAQHNR